jgi:hypothetical protein
MLSQNYRKKRPFSESTESFDLAKNERRLHARGSPDRIRRLLSERETQAFVSEMKVGFAHRFVAGFEVIIAVLSQSPTGQMKYAALKLAREIQAESDGPSQAVMARIIEAIESGEPDQLRAAEYAVTRSAELIFEYPPGFTVASRRYQRRLHQQLRNQSQSNPRRRK